jgi:hypothetical protein
MTPLQKRALRAGIPQRVKKVKYRRKGKARPMRALATGYGGMNIYRFVRETLPSTATFSLIAAGSGYNAMGYMSFENLQFNQLPGASDFENLFARYKVDKIVTTLTPMFDTATADAGGTITFSPQLEITKVNTKWMNGDFPIAANAGLQLQELAQLQTKTKSLYATKRPLSLVTLNPGVEGRSVVDSAGNEVDARRTCPWLALSGPHQAIDVPFKHNAVIFAARVDGDNLTTAWKFRVTHKVFFRCSQVG